jgi:hypothetical protein
MQRILQGSLRPALLCGALLFLAWSAHQTNRTLEGYAGYAGDPARLGPLPDGRVVRVASLGFERLIADLFWLRTVFYVGDEQVAKAGYPDAARLARLVTDIDPYFWTAYVHLNAVLTVLAPDPDSAIDLLEKAERNGADQWRIYFLQGFNHFFYRNDFPRAADYMSEAAHRGGPGYLTFLASRLYSRSGDPETAIAVLRARISQAESGKVKKRLQRRLRSVVISRDLEILDRAIDELTRHQGRAPVDLQELVGAGLLTHVPLDPAGRPYAVRDGRAYTSVKYDDLRVERSGGSE